MEVFRVSYPYMYMAAFYIRLILFNPFICPWPDVDTRNRTETGALEMVIYCSLHIFHADLSFNSVGRDKVI